MNAIPALYNGVFKQSWDGQLEGVSVEIQAEQDFANLNLLEDASARGSRELEQMAFKSPSNMKPFCVSVKCLELLRWKEQTVREIQRKFSQAASAWKTLTGGKNEKKKEAGFHLFFKSKIHILDQNPDSGPFCKEQDTQVMRASGKCCMLLILNTSFNGYGVGLCDIV